MSHVATFPLLGLLPFRDHTADVEDYCRTTIFGAAVSDTDAASGRFTFGQRTLGDLNCALHFDHTGREREIPGWAFAWPVVVGGPVESAGGVGGVGGVGGSSRGLLGGGGPAGSATRPAGAVPPGLRSGLGGKIADGLVPAPSERTVVPFVPPDVDFAPILGGDGYPVDGGFASRHIAGRALPKAWPGFPKGFVGVSMAGSKAKQELPVFLPTDPRLVAVNFAGDSRMSSIVVDLDDENQVDPSRAAPLHSMFRVIKEPEGRIEFGPRNPLALNFRGGGQDDTAGFGLFFDKVDIVEKKPGAPTTPSELGAAPKPQGTTTDLNAPYVDNRGSPSAYMPVNGQPPGGVASGAGATPATGAQGATAATSEAAAAAAKRQAGLARMHGVGTLSHKASGPIHVGSERDKHKIGKTADGETINAGHIHTEAYFYLTGNDEEEDYDAPLEFQARKYPNPKPLPFISRTHLVMDHGKDHPFVGGRARGLWRWYSEFNMGETPKAKPPPPTTPPNSPPPTTPPDPPAPPTTPSEPSIPNTPATPSAPTPPGTNPPPATPFPGWKDGLGSEGDRPTPDGGRPGPFGGSPEPSRYQGIGWAGRTAAVSPPMSSALGVDPAAPAVRAWEPADGPRSVLQAVNEEAHPVLLFRPQSLSPVASDLRRGGGLPDQVVAEAWRPMVGRLEAFGGMVGGDWETTYGPERGPYGGSGPGGVLFMPPEVSMSDADDLFAPGGVERSTVYFGFAPGGYLGFALPDLLTGGMKTGYRVGHDGAGLAKVEHLDSSGVASEVLGFDASKQLRIRDGAGTVLTFSGTLADGEYLKRDGTTLKGGTPAAALADGDYGDVSVGSSGTTLTIDNDAVTNAKAADMAQSTIKGRAAGAGTGDPTDLTAAQATAILDAVVGDSGAGGTKGLAPAPAAGDAAAGKYLFADGSYTTVPGRLLARHIFKTGTGATFTPNALATKCMIRAQAPGGGGGGGDTSGANSGAGAGGGSGGYTEKLWNVSGNLTYTVPSGGAGGAAGNNAGTAGADLTVTGTGISLTAKGGTGGSSMAGGTTAARAAGGGKTSGTTGGDDDVEGENGAPGLRFATASFVGGNGASSRFGSGAPGSAMADASTNASAYGAGGGGGSANAGSGDQAGGNGGGGILIIEEYY